MFLFKVIFSDKVSVHTNELEADIGMPLAGVMHRLSFAQQSSRYQVPWPPVQQRTAIARNYRSPLWEAWVCLETGFRLGPFLEIMGFHSLIHVWPFFAYSRVSRKLHSWQIFTHQIFNAKEDTSRFNWHQLEEAQWVDEIHPAELLNQRWSLSHHDRWRPTCELHISTGENSQWKEGSIFSKIPWKPTDLVKPLIWLIHRDDPCIHALWNPGFWVGFHPRTSTKWLINNHAAQIGRNISPEIFSISLGILVGNFPLPTSNNQGKEASTSSADARNRSMCQSHRPLRREACQRFSVRFPSAPNHQVFCNKKNALQMFRYSCWIGF